MQTVSRRDDQADLGGRCRQQVAHTAVTVRRQTDLGAYPQTRQMIGHGFEQLVPCRPQSRIRRHRQMQQHRGNVLYLRRRKPLGGAQEVIVETLRAQRIAQNRQRRR
jgi:hypothetical protein